MTFFLKFLSLSLFELFVSIVLLIHFRWAGIIITKMPMWLFFFLFQNIKNIRNIQGIQNSQSFMDIQNSSDNHWIKASNIFQRCRPYGCCFSLIQNIEDIRNIQGIQNNQSNIDIQNSSDNQGIELNLFKRCRPHECSFLVSCNFPFSRFVWNVPGNFCHQKSTVVPLSMMVLF